MKIIKFKQFYGAKILMIFLFLFILTGCNSTSVRFHNKASDTYEIFVDGKSYGTVKPNNFINISLNAGSHQFKAIQLEGFISYPTEYNKEVNLKDGESLEWSWENLLIPSK